MASYASLLDGTFRVVEIDPNGRKFDKVSRLHLREVGDPSERVEMIMDIHAELFKVRPNTELSINLLLDSTPVEYIESDQPSILQDYDYVMYGTCFKFATDKDNDNLLTVLISCGGLIVTIKGNKAKLPNFTLDSRIYVMLRV
ncbi:hypothetical protein PCE1_001718 [Barthelona sp. PCE]